MKERLSMSIPVTPVHFGSTDVCVYNYTGKSRTIPSVTGAERLLAALLGPVPVPPLQLFLFTLDAVATSAAAAERSLALCRTSQPLHTISWSRLFCEFSLGRHEGQRYPDPGPRNFH